MAKKKKKVVRQDDLVRQAKRIRDSGPLGSQQRITEAARAHKREVRRSTAPAKSVRRDTSAAEDKAFGKLPPDPRAAIRERERKASLRRQVRSRKKRR